LPEKPLEGKLHIAAGLLQYLQDGVLVVEAHLFDLLELSRIFLAGRPGVLGSSCSSHAWRHSASAHHGLHHCWVETSHSSHAACSEGIRRLRPGRPGSSCGARCSRSRGVGTSSWSAGHAAHTWHSTHTAAAAHALHHLHRVLHCLRVHHLLQHFRVVQHRCKLRILLSHLLEHRVALNNLLHDLRVRQHLLNHRVAHHLLHLLRVRHLASRHSAHSTHAWHASHTAHRHSSKRHTASSTEWRGSGLCSRRTWCSDRRRGCGCGGSISRSGLRLRLCSTTLDQMNCQSVSDVVVLQCNVILQDFAFENESHLLCFDRGLLLGNERLEVLDSAVRVYVDFTLFAI
jgi:hypothetical protein